VTLPVSIVIATWNRREDLRRTLCELADLEPVGQIIVVDNASGDGTDAMLATEFPHVISLRQAANLGVPAFGIGLVRASRPFVLLLDDDAVPARGTLPRLVDRLKAAPEDAVVACHILDQDETPVTRDWPKHPLCFWGCGVAIRRSAVAPEPYLFDPRLRLHGTELDLAIRLYARGYRMTYAPDCVVHHRFSPANRSNAARMRSLVPNALWFPAKHLPVRYALPAASRHLGLLAWRAAREGVGPAYLEGLWRGAGELLSVLDDRQAVPAPVARAYFRGVWEFEPLSARALRRVTGWPAARSSRPRGFEELSA
jgi:GT2 family glycosyltransferase